MWFAALLLLLDGVYSACDASVPPKNGGVGDCTSSLAIGALCKPTCNTGFRLIHGEIISMYDSFTKCNADGTLKSAVCVDIFKWQATNYDAEYPDPNPNPCPA